MYRCDSHVLWLLKINTRHTAFLFKKKKDTQPFSRPVLYEGNARSVLKCAEPVTAQKCAEVCYPGTLRAHFGTLRPLCCRLATSDPLGTPRNSPPRPPSSQIGDPGFEPETAKPDVRREIQ